MDESLIDGLTQAITNFRAGWFLGATTLCYLLINVLRGKTGFSVPFLTPWLEKQSKEYKTYAIVALFTAVGFFSSFASEKVTFSVIFNGVLEGLAYAAGAIGTRNIVKQGISGVQAYKDNKKVNNSEDNKDQTGSEQ